MVVADRRLELLKLEGLGLSQSEIVKQVSEKFQVSARSVYRDFQLRSQWQPVLLQLKDRDRIFYINLEAAIFQTPNDDFTTRVALNVKEACDLIQVGFEYVTGEYDDGGKIFRKRK